MSSGQLEQPIASARASVMVYDDIGKKWIPSGSSSGLSKVQIYQHIANNTFRVVGRKLQDHEVVINCSILKSLKYNQATSTFHQWRENRQVYGLSFGSKEEADAFAAAMTNALDFLNQNYATPPNSTNGYSRTVPLKNAGYQPTLDEYAATCWLNQQETDRRHHQPQYASSSPIAAPNQVTYAPSIQAAPPPPPPPPAPVAPPAPPPPPGNLDYLHLNNHHPPPTSNSVSNLADALASAKLKKTPSKVESPAEQGRGPDMASMMMDEMTKTLARRRAQAENANQDNSDLKPWEKHNGTSKGSDSPKSLNRGRLGSSADSVDGLRPEVLDRFKEELLTDIRKELAKFKQDFIESLVSELNRR